MSSSTQAGQQGTAKRSSVKDSEGKSAEAPPSGYVEWRKLRKEEPARYSDCPDRRDFGDEEEFIHHLFFLEGEELKATTGYYYWEKKKKSTE